MKGRAVMKGKTQPLNFRPFLSHFSKGKKPRGSRESGAPTQDTSLRYENFSADCPLFRPQNPPKKRTKQRKIGWEIGCTKRLVIEGRNAEQLLFRLHRAKIKVILYEKGEKESVLEVRAADYKKVFAILRAMCYNIKRETTGGGARPLQLLFLRLGAALGILLFLAGNVWLRPTVLSVEYRGNASYRKAEFSQTLQEAGVAVGKRVSAKTLTQAKNTLLAAYPTLYFVAVQKTGFRVTVTAETAFPRGELVFPQALFAPEGGVVTRVKVLRGKAEVAVGDIVSAGDLLISGSYLVGEKPLNTTVIGEVVLLCKYSESIRLPQKNEHLPQLMLARSIHAKQIDTPAEVQMEITEEGGEFIHTVTYTYALAVRGG